jgi:hypothetical protein
VWLIPRRCLPIHALFRTERQSFLGLQAGGLKSLDVHLARSRPSSRDHAPALAFYLPLRAPRTTNLVQEFESLPS